MPLQFLYNLSGDNSVGEFAEPFYRSRGTFPYPWRRAGNLYKYGNGNVRGYSLTETGAQQFGPVILALNFDLNTPNPLDAFHLPLLKDMTPAVFFDYGSVWNKNMPKFADFKASAGVSLIWDAFDFLDYAFDLKKIRFDFPLWLNHPGQTQDRIQWRWLIRFDFN